MRLRASLLIVALAAVIAGRPAPVQANLIQGNWGWKKVGTTLQIGDGLHSFKVKNRENGANIDKIILTKDKSFVPAGLGVSALAPQCR